MGQLKKLIIQIPCLNEEDQLPVALGALPRSLPGVDVVEWLIIDDGSTDATIEVARAHGVDHVVKFPQNRGLAAAFQAGLDACLKLGADFIVNTDADNQYDAGAIPDLVQPLVEGTADMVIGDRDVRNVEDFSAVKKQLQVLGSWVVNRASGADVGDTTSGFRAYSKQAALQLTVVSPYTYTVESIIQAGRTRTAIANVPVATNEKMRESRLFGSTWGYIRRNAGTITRVFAAYEPIKFFGLIALVLLTLSAVGFSPFVMSVILEGDSSGHLQSLIIASILLMGALQVAVLAVLADMMRNLRVVSQRTLERVRRLEIEQTVAPDFLVENNSTTQHAETLADALPNVPDSVDSGLTDACLLYTSPSPRDRQKSRMPSSA